MCGRYASFLPAEALAAIFGVAGPLANFPPSWNVAPTTQRPVIHRHPDAGDRRLYLLTSGLVPHFTKDLKTARRPINARADGGHVWHVPQRPGPAALPGAADAFHEWWGNAGRQAALSHRPAGRTADSVRRPEG